jgi:hypothetical protein
VLGGVGEPALAFQAAADDLLELAGSDPLTAAWARQHHQPATEWTVEPEIGAALKAADDD